MTEILKLEKRWAAIKLYIRNKTASFSSSLIKEEYYVTYTREITYPES